MILAWEGGGEGRRGGGEKMGGKSGRVGNKEKIRRANLAVLAAPGTRALQVVRLDVFREMVNRLR